VKFYRHCHHAGETPGNAYSYRLKEEEVIWLQKDCVMNFPQQLIKAGLTTPGEVDVLRSKVEKAL
jgi:TPP-dependent pyruvate/acetoin dehydrogenase alpha subunit